MAESPARRTGATSKFEDGALSMRPILSLRQGGGRIASGSRIALLQTSLCSRADEPKQEAGRRLLKFP